jgi:FkbM family methyltransferase
MSWRTHPLAISLRNVGRATRINRLLVPFVLGSGYESAFEESLLAAIQPGDYVWDVGANVGLYTVKFASKIGDTGRVLAFEPSATNRNHLQNSVSSIRNVVVVPLALGDRDGIMRFAQGCDALGATSRIVDSARNGVKGTTEVQVARADSLIATGTALVPNVVKIDTEGSELDVLQGFGDLICRPELRALFIEVHFGLLQARGLSDGPQRIERLLMGSGFCCRWTDPSHLIARRPAE